MKIVLLSLLLTFTQPILAESNLTDEQIMKNITAPMEEVQKEECDLYLQEYVDFKSCESARGCRGVYDRWLTGEDPPASLYPFEIALTRGHTSALAIYAALELGGNVTAGATAVGSGSAYTAALAAKTEARKRALERAGLWLFRLTKIAALGSTGVGLLILAAEGIYYASKDSCPAGVPFEELADECKHEALENLQRNFADKIQLAVSDPDQLREVIWEDRENGVHQKLICNGLQQKVEAWRQKMHDWKSKTEKLTCEGYLIRIHGEHYLLQDNGNLIRHKGMDATLTFDFQNDRLLKESRWNSDRWVFDANPTPGEFDNEIQSVFPHILPREVEEWVYLREFRPLIHAEISACNGWAPPHMDLDHL